jgi:uncharacterized protein YukJ
MPHFQQSHNTPLNKSGNLSQNLPHNTYGGLTGVLDGPIAAGSFNHILIYIKVDSENRYELAFNTESTDNSDDKYDVVEENVEASQLPPQGFEQDSTVDYQKLGLTENDFQSIANSQLSQSVQSSLQQADLITAYGFTYSNGSGLHDIHYNNGEPAGSRHPNSPGQDGALAIYYKDSAGNIKRRWFFIKFQEQTL